MSRSRLRKALGALACALAAASLLSGCAAVSAFLSTDAPATPEPVIAQAVTPSPTATPEPTPTPVPTPTPTPEPQNRSQTSGRVIPEGTPSRPFILSIDNAPARSRRRR